MHDEKGVVKIHGKPAPRRGPVPCETSIGCLKGHWKDRPDLTPSQAMAITLYQSSKVSGGTMLNDAERSDDFLAECFAGLAEVDSLVEQSRRRSEMDYLAIRLRSILKR